MRKVMIPLIILAFIISFTFPGTSEANNNRLQSIEQQIQKLKREKREAEKKANEAMNRIEAIELQKRNAKQDINTIMKQIDDSSEKLMDVEERIAASEEELNINEAELKQALERVDQRDALLRSRVWLMYTNGSVNYLEVLLNATSFSDFLDRFSSIKMIVNQDKEILKAEKRDKELILQKGSEIQTILTDLRTDYSELTSIRQNLLIKEKSKEVLIASLEVEEEELEDYTKEQEAFLLKTARKEAELIKQRNNELNNQNKVTNTQKSGKFAYPLPKKYRLTSGFGKRVDPVTGKKGAFHKGLDFGAPGGTNVLASSEGTVLVAQFYGGYGKTVIIDHGDGKWTLYAHMRQINVSKGSSVKQGEVIGEVGSTGKSTGNHLHFEIRINEEAVDPRTYIKI